MNYNCSNLSDLRNLQEPVKKAFCCQKLFWINCSSDFKMFAKSQPSASNFKKNSRSLEQFFLTAVQTNFGNKIPFLLQNRSTKSHKMPFYTRKTMVESVWHSFSKPAGSLCFCDKYFQNGLKSKHLSWWLKWDTFI